VNSSCTLRRGISCLLRPEEIEVIFSDGWFYENASFYILDRTTQSYDVLRKERSFLDEARALSRAFRAGDSIIVKNLEGFNQEIRMKCAALGPRVDVHLYLVPPGGDASFDFHRDDRDVWVHLVYGRKRFITRSSDIEQCWDLSAGDELYIPMGVLHRAVPMGPSALMSFGVPREATFSIPGGITLADLGTSPGGL
jgi:mannose-6-phosphate isomerase-like protein (cupin superfamily)